MIRLALLLGTGYMAYRYMQKQKQSTTGSGTSAYPYEGTGTTTATGAGVAGMGASAMDSSDPYATGTGMTGGDLGDNRPGTGGSTGASAGL